MIQGNKILTNPYYFVKDNVIFNISNSNNDDDICAKHYKTYDTETVELTKGQTYVDNHGDSQIATIDGEYNVSKGTDSETATVTANKGVFPYYEITYTHEGETHTSLFWLNHLIGVGDKTETSGKKFKNKTIHKTTGSETTMTYEAYFKTLVMKDIHDKIKGGVGKQQIIGEYAMLIVGQETLIDGVIGKITNVTADVKLTETNIIDEIAKVIKEYGDKKLLEYNKQCTVTTEALS